MQFNKTEKSREMYAIPLIAKSAMNGAQFHVPWVGNAGGELTNHESPCFAGAVVEV
jgi:hypothetical protein